jgi:hypothetical protein
VSAQAAGYLKHSLDGFGASFFHHIGGAKFLSQRNAVAMVAQHYHLLGSKSARCHYAAQSYRAVTSSFATGKENSVPSASGMRTASAWAPAISSLLRVFNFPLEQTSGRITPASVIDDLVIDFSVHPLWSLCLLL